MWHTYHYYLGNFHSNYHPQTSVRLVLFYTMNTLLSIYDFFHNLHHQNWFTKSRNISQISLFILNDITCQHLLYHHCKLVLIPLIYEFKCMKNNLFGIKIPLMLHRCIINELSHEDSTLQSMELHSHLIHNPSQVCVLISEMDRFNH
jgi:hypothetical protein